MGIPAGVLQVERCEQDLNVLVDLIVLSALITLARLGKT